MTFRALLAVLLLGGPAAALTCSEAEFEGVGYSLCEVGPGDDLRLFHSGPDGAYGQFGAVERALEGQGLELAFAMNAGMYHRDLSPVGLYVEEGREVSALITRDVPDNFGLLPNGVFCVGAEGRFAVVESRLFDRERPSCRFATQSGPMLVIGGDLHPKFIPTSDSLNIRNGVGVSPDGARAVFAISDGPVNFHTFARFFRDALGLDEALFLDGSISRLFAPELGRRDGGFAIGPIVGVVRPRG
ncbi:MAG: phosphodiester glycosidase family protein [Paracoccaceae bacterium]